MDEIGIVINKKAKNAALLRPYLDAFTTHNIHYKLYQTSPQNLDKTIKESLKKHTTLLIGGGDGTVRSAAQLCVNTSTVLGVLPLGTLNHFAKELALPTTAKELIHAIKKKKTITIDCAEVNGFIFLNNSSIGLYPSFARKRDYYMKFYNKWLSYLPGIWLAFQDNEPLNVTIKGKNIHYSLNTSFMMISNNIYSLNFPHVFERESFQKSLLGIYFFKHGKFKILKILRSLLNNKNNFEIKKTSESITIVINERKKVSVSLDGETILLSSPLVYKSQPKSLTLLTDKS